jgi:hypothetical protein
MRNIGVVDRAGASDFIVMAYTMQWYPQGPLKLRARRSTSVAGALCRCFLVAPPHRTRPHATPGGGPGGCPLGAAAAARARRARAAARDRGGAGPPPGELRAPKKTYAAHPPPLERGYTAPLPEAAAEAAGARAAA